MFNQPLPHLHVQEPSRKDSLGPYYVSVKILLWDFSVEGSFFTVHLTFYIQIAHNYGERDDTFKPIRTGGSSSFVKSHSIVELKVSIHFRTAIE